MAGSNNFVQFDQNQTNMYNDVSYNALKEISDGVGTGIADPMMHNKMYYQLSTMVAALGNVFSNLGYTVSDADISNLETVLGNILTTQGGSLEKALKQAPQVTITSSSGVLTLPNTSNIFLANGSEAIASITGWTQGIAFIKWNTARTLTASSSLVLTNGGSNRTTAIGDVGIYQITSSVTTELIYMPIAGNAEIPVSVDKGGTGATTAAAARTNLGSAPSGYGLGTAAATATSDWNNYLTTGFFIGNNLTNAPTSGSTTWYYVIVIRYQDTYVYQRATGYGTAAFNSFERRCNAGTWTDWKRIATSSDFNFNDFRTVVSTVTSNTAATITADYCPYTQASISLTLSMSTTGANALDNGTVAASTWYYTYVIYNPTTNTVACLASNSSTTPTLPNGYTYYCRVGAILTNSSSYLYRIIQKGRDAGYIVDGTILTGLRQMATGVTGSVSTPTWVAVSVSGFVPPTASTIDILIPNIASTSQTMVAPNANYGAWNSVTNPPPISIGDSATSTQYGGWGRLLLESTNIYWANTASATGYGIYCKGYTDNL